MPICRFQLREVGPFDDVMFEFDEHVNVFVGPNNSGKTCALVSLASAVVWPPVFARRFARERGGHYSLWFRAEDGRTERIAAILPWDTRSAKSVPSSDGEFMMLRSIGYSRFVPALRLSTSFRSKGPTVEAGNFQELLGPEDVSYASLYPRPTRKEAREEFARRERIQPPSTSVLGDDEVVQEVIDFDYKSYREDRPAMRSLLRRIAAIASEITEAFPLEFLKVAEDKDGLFPLFRTPDGDLPLSSLSQGTQSVIQWLAHVLIGYAEYYDFPEDLDQRPAVLIIDEIDAHLHPSWQRQIVPALTRHFPALQLFCATHSPLMLAGLKAGQVHLLKREAPGKVTVSRNEADIRGWSADEILRCFLDVPAPTDTETEKHVQRLAELRDKPELSAEESEELEQLRQTVRLDLLRGPGASDIAHLEDLLKSVANEGRR